MLKKYIQMSGTGEKRVNQVLWISLILSLGLLVFGGLIIHKEIAKGNLHVIIEKNDDFVPIQTSLSKIH